MKAVNATLAVSAILLCSCGGGGGDAKSSCQSIGSHTNAVTTSGEAQNVPAAADGNLSTFATLTGVAGSYISSEGNQFPGGSNAGAFITPPAGMKPTDITVSTFMTVDSTMVESATGPALVITPTQGDPATDYVSFKTTAPFNGVKLAINAASSVQYLVYELCGTATVR